MKEAEAPLVEGLDQEILHEERTFQEKIDSISVQYEQCLFMEQRGISLEGENVDNTFVTKRMKQVKEDLDLSKSKKDLEGEYISLVCEASPEEFNDWKERSLDRLMCGLIREIIEEKVRDQRDSLEGERLFSVFQLYMTAKARRDENY